VLILVVVLGDIDNDIIPQQKLGVVMHVGIEAVANGSVRHGAEYASLVLRGDNSLPAAAHWMAALRADERVGKRTPENS